MCGILGIFGKNHKHLAEKIVPLLSARGKDHLGMHSTQEYTIVHALHAIVGHVPQPLIAGHSVFAANCEVYNYKEFTKGTTDSFNDAQATFQLFAEKGVEKSIQQLDGDFAFIYVEKDHLYFACDPIGVKPLWYASNTEIFVVGSEAKMIQTLGLEPQKCLPATLYKKSLNSNDLVATTYWEPPSLEARKEKNIQIVVEQVLAKFRASIKKRSKIKKAAVLFSGGVDSTFVAKELSVAGIEVTLYTAAYQHGNIAISRDLIAARETAKILGLPLQEVIVDQKQLLEHLPKTIEIIELTNPVQVSVALPIYFCCRQAQLDGHRVIFSGLGSEEIFAGYNRHGQAKDINTECRAGLMRMHATDLYRDDLLSIHHNLELRVPFLDKDLVEYGLNIPSELKIQGNTKKFILRQAAKLAKVPEMAAHRPKLAAQYGSNFQKGLDQCAQGDLQAFITSFKKKTR